MKKHVVSAIFIKDNKVLCCRRTKEESYPLMWEFPGGKIELGETKEEALIREIKEELSSDITILRYYQHVSYRYERFDLDMDIYLCELNTDDIQLNVHSDAKWFNRHEAIKLDWLKADIPIIEQLIKDELI
ncbi:(deoxy)nucleoside triphosphate pyrophosphohydrolase [Haloplasma contractile]|uniref:8-oxo-dGTP diphosphatase n=1 Tax=Haloplasma contractile SSD-17B TaxID=1033810 RepID=U2EAH2_9MOLU|nr:(deoxy)nucleoside triphosphate pyrophosphohydrolase [Haloplasma contractile]ERJ12098.1 A-G-specific adenine glycosylase protein [Haloplasma contractile SSD-17B]